MSDTSLLFSLVKVVIVLGLILFLIYYVVKFLNKRNKMLQKVKAMENLGGVSVGTNKSVQIVRIGQQLYLLGVGDNVEMLKEITDPETKNSILKQQQDAGETAGPKVDIASLFAKKKTAQQADEGSNFRRQFMQELDKMKTTRQRILNEHQKDDGHE
ncbi:flagellar biosynthetic protein FliO [Virgibacillus halophilus]|uniref:Flagellar protein n=2 Tax=Tigheibacillus halophilus TaxID=361280 RepID=A0ABU5CAM6_9BACI|nr:flagellar biosynthetic protein FliO [Virgibacillus halophilus]